MISESALVQIKNVIEDSHLNFLIGSGLSAPYLSTLGNIETLLTDIEAVSLPAPMRDIIRCSIYKRYFDEVMAKNLKVLEGDASCADVLAEYNTFLKSLNAILQRRRNSLLGKEVNLFTTNIDVFQEKAIEDIGLEFNDGFNGRFKPTFSLSNFHKSRFKHSLHFDNVSELPVFNLFKVHGSLTWHFEDEDTIVFSRELNEISSVANVTMTLDALVPVDDASTAATLQTAATGLALAPCVTEFLNAYDELLIVNPTKDKFKRTIFNYTHYEMLRMFSNEMEKNNTVLFVMGFSFADQHIREIVLRAANSNPTLMVYVIAYSTDSANAIRKQFVSTSIKNSNIQFIEPPAAVVGTPPEHFDFAAINRELFGKIFTSLHSTDDDDGVAA
jgi:hypothetical protein